MEAPGYVITDWSWRTALGANEFSLRAKGGTERAMVNVFSHLPLMQYVMTDW